VFVAGAPHLVLTRSLDRGRVASLSYLLFQSIDRHLFISSVAKKVSGSYHAPALLSSIQKLMEL
jgi:hypothetical protein